MRVRKIFIFLLAFILACRYSFTGASVPPHLRTIAVPLFDDRSGFGQASIREELTNRIIEKFIDDNTLRIADKDVADSILEGVILQITDRPVAVGAGEVVNRRRVSITVRVVFRDMVKRRKVWERNFTNWGEYEPTMNIERRREEAIKFAIDKLAEDILLSTVSNW